MSRHRVHDAPPRARGRGARRVLAVIALAGVAALVRVAWTAGVRQPVSGGVRLGPGASLTRAGVRVAPIERVGRARGRGRLPLYLAPAAGPVVDSARVGVLAARLLPGTGGGAEPVIAFVPRDSVAGLAPVGRLVVTPGEPGLLVFGRRAAGR